MEFVNESCKQFVEVLSTKEPVPGGGGAASLVSAIGVALGNMVLNLTEGKKKYEQYFEDIKVLKEKAEKLQARLLELVDEDAKCFEPLAKAYSLPKDLDPELKAKTMENALKTACSVPLEIMECCCEGIDLQEDCLKKGTALAISDVGVGVLCLKSGLLGASLNVFINTSYMKDKEYANELNETANNMIAKYSKKADEIYEGVLKKII